jgi:chaperone required for assembly of F1-ATPase
LNKFKLRLVQFQIGKTRGKKFYLKTNNDHTIVFPNKTSAMAVLSEWEIQTEMIRVENLPLSMVFGKIEDLRNDPITKEKAKNEILKYFESELICHRELLKPELKVKYHETWNPIVDWFEKEYKVKLKIFESEELIGDASQNDAKEAFKKELQTYNEYQIGFLYSLLKVTDSVVIAIAALKGKLTPEETMRAMAIDVFINIETNGLVYGEHDILLSLKKMKLSTIFLAMELIKN